MTSQRNWTKLLKYIYNQSIRNFKKQNKQTKEAELTNFFFTAIVTLTPKTDKDKSIKENNTSTFLIILDSKMYNKILSNRYK